LPLEILLFGGTFWGISYVYAFIFIIISFGYSVFSIPMRAIFPIVYNCLLQFINSAYLKVLNMKFDICLIMNVVRDIVGFPLTDFLYIKS
jgi:hypothetical protein